MISHRYFELTVKDSSVEQFQYDEEHKNVIVDHNFQALEKVNAFFEWFQITKLSANYVVSQAKSGIIHPNLSRGFYRRTVPKFFERVPVLVPK